MIPASLIDNLKDHRDAYDLKTHLQNIQNILNAKGKHHLVNPIKSARRWGTKRSIDKIQMHDTCHIYEIYLNIYLRIYSFNKKVKRQLKARARDILKKSMISKSKDKMSR